MASGGILTECIKAAEFLLKEGITARVLSMHTIKPIDKVAITACAKETKNIITVEEHNKHGGLVSAVAEVITEYQLDCKLGCVAIDDLYSSIVGSQDYLRKFYKLDHKAIIKKCKAILDPNDHG